MVSVIGSLTFLATYFGYPVFFWVVVGATPGKRLLGLSVIQTDGRRLNVFRAVMRVFGYWLSAMGGWSRDPALIELTRTIGSDYRALTAEDVRKALAAYVVDQGAWSLVVLPARAAAASPAAGAAPAAAAATRPGVVPGQ